MKTNKNFLKILLLAVFTVALTSQSEVKQKAYIIRISDYSKEYKSIYKKCLNNDKVSDLVKYFFTKGEQEKIKEKKVSEFKFEFTPYILDSTSCNGLYIYTLYPNKLVKRSHPIDKSSFIIIDNKVYPATLDTNKNIIFLDDNREILKRYFSPKQLIEMKRVYSKGVFGISTTADWFFTPYKH